MCMSINKQLVSFQNYFDILDRLCQGRGYRKFPHCKRICGQLVAHQLWVVRTRYNLYI